LSEDELTQTEIKSLQEAMSAEIKTVNLRLRQGEYQYDLAKTIASFLLELRFPNVKELIERLYGEGRANDIQFVREIQTILKKMERSSIVRILPKEKPWKMQGYSLLSFKFQDAERSLIVLATEQQIRGNHGLLTERLKQTEAREAKPKSIKTRAYILTLTTLIVISYAAILYMVSELIVNLSILVPAFSIAIVCSVILGKVLSR
jgi:hypothetical protein